MDATSNHAALFAAAIKGVRDAGMTISSASISDDGEISIMMQESPHESTLMGETNSRAQASATDSAHCAGTRTIGAAVIVRSRDAGVLYGHFAGMDGSTIHLTNAVQLWRWKAAQGGTLLDVATYGVVASGCKFSLAKAAMTVFAACALIDCTDVAWASIEAVKGGDWK